MKNASILLALLLFALLGNAQNSTSTNETDSLQVFSFVEKMPEYPGGLSALLKFFQDNVVYPKADKDLGIEGKVLVRFVITADGSVANIAIAKSVSFGLDSEALRVVGLLPKFTPGTQQGKAVSVYYNLPFNFTLTDDEKNASPYEKKKNNDPNFRNAISLIKYNDNKEAIKALDLSIEQYPDDYLSYQLKGDCYINLNDHNEACKCFKLAKKKGAPDIKARIKKACN